MAYCVLRHPGLILCRERDRTQCSQSRDRRHPAGCSSCCREALQPFHISGPPAHRDFSGHTGTERQSRATAQMWGQGHIPRPTSLLHEGLELRTLPVWVPKPLLCIATHLRAENRGPREMVTRTGGSLCRRPRHKFEGKLHRPGSQLAFKF